MNYDRRAVGYVRRLERAVPPKGKLDFEYVEIGALLNAIETHLESGMGHADVVQCYENVFVLLTSLRGFSSERIGKAKAIFRDLKQYLRTSQRRHM
jgi:hypothetical protein